MKYNYYLRVRVQIKLDREALPLENKVQPRSLASRLLNSFNKESNPNRCELTRHKETSVEMTKQRLIDSHNPTIEKSKAKDHKDNLILQHPNV